MSLNDETDRFRGKWVLHEGEYRRAWTVDSEHLLKQGIDRAIQETPA